MMNGSFLESWMTSDDLRNLKHTTHICRSWSRLWHSQIALHSPWVMGLILELRPSSRRSSARYSGGKCRTTALNLAHLSHLRYLVNCVLASLYLRWRVKLKAHRSLAVARGRGVQILHFSTLTLQLALLFLNLLWLCRHVVACALDRWGGWFWFVLKLIFGTWHICRRLLLLVWRWFSCLDLLVDGWERLLVSYDGIRSFLFAGHINLFYSNHSPIRLIKRGLGWHGSIIHHHLGIIILSLT